MHASCLCFFLWNLKNWKILVVVSFTNYCQILSLSLLIITNKQRAKTGAPNTAIQWHNYYSLIVHYSYDGCYSSCTKSSPSSQCQRTFSSALPQEDLQDLMAVVGSQDYPLWPYLFFMVILRTSYFACNRWKYPLVPWLPPGWITIFFWWWLVLKSRSECWNCQWIPQPHHQSSPCAHCSLAQLVVANVHCRPCKYQTSLGS